ncbi:MAG: HAMP domain-containing protein [Ignavibacteria bacterium]|nr:MAG: HAMP domain-containing protein [Ignavibacteria bacterium]
MKFRNKILLAIWGVVLVLLFMTFFVVRYWTEVQVKERSIGSLQSNYTTLRELTSLRSAEIAKSCEIVAETPRLKAVVELRDPNTATQLAQELNKSVASDLFLVRDSHGKMLVRLLEGKLDTLRAIPPPIAPARRDGEERSSTDVLLLNDAVYRCAMAPIAVGPDILGTLTLGFRIEKADLDAIGSMTGSDVVLISGDSTVCSTFPRDVETGFGEWLRPASRPAGSSRLGRAMRDGAGSTDTTAPSGPAGGGAVINLSINQDRYLGTSFLLGGGHRGEVPQIQLILLKPIEREVQAALKPVFNTFLILSILVLSVTAGIGYLISQGITRPIAALVQGTTEISRGNYDYVIEVGRDAEIRYLAEKFSEMSDSLKDKMRQLAVRNAELEQALGQLKSMQAELLKSERLAATGKLTAQIAHEINNPVHNIQSCLQTLLKRTSGPEDPAHREQRELLEVALEEVTRLARLTGQMLDVYRTSAVPIERIPVSLNEVIQELVTTSSEALRRQRIDVRLELLPTLPFIEGSKDKLKQVLLNLFLNAQDAMPNGGTLAIETDQRNGNVFVHVADSGVGIPPENIHRVFDAFFTTKSTVSGVGLGLAVTYGIIRQHGGNISVRSAVGKGTKFSLSFPVRS